MGMVAPRRVATKIHFLPPDVVPMSEADRAAGGLRDIGHDRAVVAAVRPRR
jgi:hypothetical protein